MFYYNKYSDYLKNKYGEKVYKLPVNLPITCPNRLNGLGCTFCAEVGTGFEAMDNYIPIREQLEKTKLHIKKKYKANKYIAYFQNYTNTFMPLDVFKKSLEEACSVEDVVELSVSTRPDCINKAYLMVLEEISQTYNVSINIEMGLQTVNYHTLHKIQRGHTLAEYINAVLLIKEFEFSICSHVIINLPYDNNLDVIETAKIISSLGIPIVKIHSLYIAKNTKMAEDFLNGKICVCSKEEYYERLALFLEYLDNKIVIERLFSRIPKDDMVFSNWETSWWKLQDEFMDKLTTENRYQGKSFNYLNGSALEQLN